MTSVRGASFLALIVMTASCKGGERRPSSRTESLQRAADANTSTEKHAFSALPPGEEADRLLAALGQCASTVALKFPSDWQASQSGGDDCITTEVKMPGEERPVWFGSCWGKPPEKAHAWKKVSDLGDTVTRCTFGRRYSQRITDLSCIVTFQVWGEAPYVTIEAAEVGVSVAEQALSIARSARVPLSCRPVRKIGCMVCESIERGLMERSRVLHGDPPLGPAGPEATNRADSNADGGGVEAPPAVATVPFEPWCQYTIDAPARGTMHLLREPRNDGKDCEAYRIDAGNESVGTARICQALPSTELGRPRERRSYRWEMPQGLFTFDVDFVEGGKWLFAGRLQPASATEAPMVVEFASVDALPADRLRALVMLASSAELRPRECEDLKHGRCARCGSILDERARVRARGVLGPN